MLRHVIFHLNILVDPAFFRAHYQIDLADIMHSRYGKSQQFWIDIQERIFADWASYHADLNYNATDGVADMCESPYHVTRTLFRLAQISEPSKQ